jgi:putative glutamine amidotransferase
MMHPDPTRALFKGKRLLYMEESMFHWVMREGAMAFMLPTAPPAGTSVADLVAELDGVIMTGGVDMAPESYGETALRPEWAGDGRRDAYDLELVRTALALDKPLLGICRGHQVLNVAMGGSLFQDISTQNPGSRVHRDWEVYDGNKHPVRLETHTGMGRIYPGTKDGVINSVHHQGVKDLGKELVVEAWSEGDGIVEALRLKGRSEYLLGVQWHPEFQDPADRELLSPTPIMREFLDAARVRRQ